MKKLLIITLILTAIISCRTTKKTTIKHEKIANSDTTIYKTDSIIIEKTQTIVDTQFFIKPDSASIKALIECDKHGRAFIKEIKELKAGRYVRPNISIIDNILTATAEIDSFAIYFQYKNTHESTVKISGSDIEINNTETETYTESIKKVIYRLPWWIWACVIIMALLAARKYLFPNFLNRN